MRPVSAAILLTAKFSGEKQNRTGSDEAASSPIVMRLVGAEYSVSPGGPLIRGGRWESGRASVGESVAKSGAIRYSRARVKLRDGRATVGKAEKRNSRLLQGATKLPVCRKFRLVGTGLAVA
jgi:hypothetical protein